MTRGLTDSDIILWYAKKDLARLEAWWECNVTLDQATPQGWKPVIEGKELECRVFDAMTWCRYALNTDGDYGNKWDRLLIIRELLIELYLPNGNPLKPLSPTEAGRSLISNQKNTVRSRAAKEKAREWFCKHGHEYPLPKGGANRNKCAHVMAQNGLVDYPEERIRRWLQGYECP